MIMITNFAWAQQSFAALKARDLIRGPVLLAGWEKMTPVVRLPVFCPSRDLRI